MHADDKVVFKGKVNLGRYVRFECAPYNTDRAIGYVNVEVEIRISNHKRQTVDHKIAKRFFTVAFSGSFYKIHSRDGDIFGQCGSEIEEMLRYEETGKQGANQCFFFKPLRVDLERAKLICELWDRWHLNDMNPGCIHQGHVSGNLPHEEWLDRQAEETRKCPAGYKYGSEWLVEIVPGDTIMRIIGLFDPTCREVEEARSLLSDDPQIILERGGLKIKGVDENEG